MEKSTYHFKLLSETEKAYIAGLLDGEGSIFISRNYYYTKKGRQRFSHLLKVSIANTDYKIMLWLKSKCNGCISIYPAKRQNTRESWQWVIGSIQARYFLEAISPYVRIKILQLQLAIKFQKRKEENGSCSVSDSEIENRENYKFQISKLCLRPKDLLKI